MKNVSESQSNQTVPTSTIATTAGSLTEAAITILEEHRHLNIEIVVGMGWRSKTGGKSSRPGSNGEDEEVWIEIPYFVDGKEVNCKRRTIAGPKKFFQTEGGKKVLYNHAHIAQWQQSPNQFLLITEGEMDCMVAIGAGYLAVSVPDGAPATRTEEQSNDPDRRSLKYAFLDDFPKTGKVIICSDNDEPGLNLLHDLADRIGKHRCKYLRYPKGCKDLNDVLIRYGEKGITETIRRAEWMTVEGVFRMSQLPPEPAQDVVHCEIIPINLRTCELSVWTGIPGHGKTSLTNFISMAVTKAGWNTSVASFEQSPQRQHRRNLRTLHIGFNPARATQAEIDDADQFIDRNFTFIVPDLDSDDDADLSWLLEKMAIAVTRYDAKLIIIDPWNELDHTFDKREMSITDYTGFAVKQLRKFARRYRVHVAVVAHPAKIKPEGSNKTPMPTAYDIADSAHWANKPDLIVIVHRAKGMTQVRVAKTRDEEIGETGDHWLDYDRDTKQFTTGITPPSASFHPKTKKKKADATEAEPAKEGELFDE